MAMAPGCGRTQTAAMTAAPNLIPHEPLDIHDLQSFNALNPIP